MASVYVVKESGNTEPMTQDPIKSEDKDLQRLLEYNLDLLPGDQIDPESPRRWMLIKREMPVPGPTGAEKYWLDFLLVDQDATPTFVECKRYLSAESHKKVVGQLLEYAANAQRFWSPEVIGTYAEKSAVARGTTSEQSIEKLESEFGSDPDTFFKEVAERLKDGNMRLVFFLDKAPPELKRLVEFLNEQMKRAQVLLVEARQFERDGTRIVVPTLFGFTERIREIKASSSGERQAVAVDWEGFRANAQQKGLSEDDIARIRKLYDACRKFQADLAWGRGTVTGSFSPRWTSLGVKSAPFSVYANGNLELHFVQFHSSKISDEFVNTLAEGATQTELILPKDHMNRWCNVPPDEWLPKVDVFIAALEKAVAGIGISAAAQ